MSRFGILDKPRISEMVRGNVRVPRRSRPTPVERLVSHLSEGNQQKIVLAKWLNTAPEILLLDEPTAGVDVSSKGEIIDFIRNFASAGKSVILVSSEITELLAVSDRILVLNDGRISREMMRDAIQSEEEVQLAIQKMSLVSCRP